MTTFHRSKSWINPENGLNYYFIGEVSHNSNNKLVPVVPERETCFELNERLRALFDDRFGEAMEGYFEFINTPEVVEELLSQAGILHEPGFDGELVHIQECFSG
jgi:hypothetical protein